VLHKSVARAVALAGALGAFGGCDLVFMLERPPMPTVCGAFGGAREVKFGDELSEIRDLSFNADASRGFVNATLSTAAEPRTGPVPLIFDKDADRWIHDADREANWRVLVDQRAYHARMARDNQLWVGQVLTSPISAYHVFHYDFVSGMWAPIENEVGLTSGTDAYPGGELNVPAVGANPPDTSDFLPIFRTDTTTFVRSVTIAWRQAGTMTWQDQELAGGLPTTDVINEQHQAWSGALAFTPEERQVMIYAATPNGEDVDSDLFISEKRSGRFVEGVPLTGFNTDDEELEPWVSEDCSMITFRRAPRGSPLEGDPALRGGGRIYMSTLE
jgi:hypothetical protein